MESFFQAAMSDLFEIILAIAWVIVPVFLAALFWKLRLFRKRVEFMSKVEWKMLEIKLSRDVARTPRAMEQVFASLYGIYSFGIPWLPKYFDGKVDLWLSFEMVGRGGGIYFYVRTPAQFQNLVEAAIYSQYAEAEIMETNDYVQDMPQTLPNDTFDLFGTGFKLNKENVYPIRTYDFFEDPKDEKRLDPLSTIFEAMSKLKNDEMIWIQLLVSPTGKATGVDLAKEAEAEVKKIMEEKGAKRKNSEGEEIPVGGMFGLSKGYQEVIASIERKVAKLAFQATLRFVYIDKKDAFTPINIPAVMGSFQQFNTLDMNSMRPDATMTILGGLLAKLLPWYKKMIILSKKRRIYDYYRKRRFGISNRLADEKLMIFNTEELATLFHFSSSVAKAPKLQTVSSKKGEPPVNLPLEP